MKAAIINGFGDVDVLKYEDIETPTPKPGYVLVKVLAAIKKIAKGEMAVNGIVPGQLGVADEFFDRGNELLLWLHLGDVVIGPAA